MISQGRAARRVAVLLLLLGVSPAAHAAEGLTLDDAIRLALTRNERAASAQARVEAAAARLAQARSFFFPDVTLTGNYTRRAYETVRQIGNENVTVQSHNALSSALLLNQSVLDLRAIPLYRQARLELRSTDFSAKEDKRLLAFEAADAFIATLSVDRVEAAAERRRNFAATSLTDARARFEAGLVSSNDVTKAELELATAERELSRARGDLATAYLELSNLVNSDVKGPLVPPALVGEETAEPVQEDALVAEAKRRRLDVASLQLHAAALREYAKEPAVRIVPTLTLNGQTRTTNEPGVNGHEIDGFLALNLNWSAFDGGEWRAARAERLALAHIAELDATALVRDVERQVRAAVVDVESEKASLRQATAATEAARRNAQESSELYRQGLASALEVADASVSLFESEVAEARARYALAVARLDLRAATGVDPLGKEKTE